MATIRKRGVKWQVQVRRQGHPDQSRTFTLKSDAQVWARQVETQADKQSLPVDHQQLARLKVRDLIERYRDIITPCKGGSEVETIRLNVFLRQDFADLRLTHISPKRFSQFRDQRMAEVSSGTVLRELSLLQSVFEIARKDWDVPLAANPLISIRKPTAPRGRHRRLEDGELRLLLKGCDKCRNEFIRPLILLAIETGMRQGELLNIHWPDLEFQVGTLFIPQTKTGNPRTIPLTTAATSILKSLCKAKTCERVFPLSSESVKRAWRRLTYRVGLEDLRFHDLRHEAISRFFEMGLSVPEVALISGHRDPRMLFRYTHLRVEDVGAKLLSASKALSESS